MRLLQLGPNDELTLTDEFPDGTPPYAILSHTWGSKDSEVTFQDVTRKSGTDKLGYQKLLFCGKQAHQDGLDYFWVDTCCIDKTSSQELTEAINSMFRWYQSAQACYVYLADVSYGHWPGDEPPRSTWKSHFRKSRWFTRGWTLQELIAPRTVEFFSSEGLRLGNKQTLEQTICEITHIPVRALQADSLSEFSFEERISWSNTRKTSREEDKAYSLLGILGVYMTLIYSEGEEGAFKRLRSTLHAQKSDSTGDPKMDADLHLCLADLRTTDPRDDKSRIESTKGGLLKDSYRWIIENGDFLHWRDSNAHSLLWIKGDPGKGKTMLLCGIIDELSASPTAECLVSYFFCQATDTNLNNALAVLRGLVYMLVRNNHLLLRHLYEDWKVAGSKLFDDANAWDALVRIVTAILQNHRSAGFVFIIDALDECSKDRDKLLRFIIEQSRAGQAKWIVSSRNWPEIEEQLEAASRKVRLSLELNDQSISAAVSTYIRHKVFELQSIKRFDDRKRDEIIESLTVKADKTFLWVALVCQQLRNPKLRVRHLSNELQRFPPGLDALYVQMLRLIDESLDTELCHKVLSIASIVYRPVSLAELMILFGKTDDVDDVEVLRDVVRSCGSFLTIRDDVVYFVHQSVKDFLIGKASNKIFIQGIERENLLICSTSIESLSEALRHDIYNLRHPGTSITEIRPPDPDPLAPLRYSCSYWIDHFIDGHLGRRTGTQGDGRHELVRIFLEEKYLYWLESLSLLGSISQGVHSMTRLLDLTQTNQHSEPFSRLVFDALRFIQYSSLAIAENPLQVYASALIFSPTRSIIRKRFRDKEPKWLTLRPKVREDWSACQQTFTGHSRSVTSVAFSPDSRLVASASNDGTIRIWSIDGGNCRQTLEGHSEAVTSVTFSPDGLLLASGARDKTVRIWSVNGGECQQTLGHSDTVRSVAFSPNGRLLASASTDKLVHIGSVDGGGFQQTLIGHNEDVASVAFSPDGLLVASASGDKTIRIWSVSGGEWHKTLTGHSGRVNSVTFSPDGRLVVSASEDNTVRIWSANGSHCQQILEHSDTVKSVAFSPDGLLVASASWDRTVRIWSVDGGVCQQAFTGHSGVVTSVAFSPNGRLVASASGDETVRIWSVDGDGGDCQKSLTSHSDYVSSVIFSPNGRLVASASEDSTVRIWSVDSGGDCQQMFIGHSHVVSSVAFSPDGLLLASASYDRTVRIWAIDGGGDCQQTLIGHDQPVFSVAFSPDGLLVASASSDKTVRIWSVNGGKWYKTLTGHIDSVTSAVFSPDGRLVASAAFDATVRIWSIDAGGCQQIIDVGLTAYNLSFINDGETLLANNGTISIPLGHLTLSRDGTPRKSTQTNHHLGILGRDGTWVTFNGENILRLPPDFPPSRSSVFGSTIAIGCDSGNVIIMGFDGRYITPKTP